MKDLELIQNFLRSHEDLVDANATDERDRCKMKSILVFTFLYQKHFDITLPEDIYEKLLSEDCGLVGPGKSCLTDLCHSLFQRYAFIRNHAILHDSYGRFFQHFGLDKGYTYNIHSAPDWIKGCSWLGQISGLYFCYKNKIEL